MDEIIPGFGQPVAAVPPAERRADKTGVQLLERNRSEVEAWFGHGRRWRICTELNGPAELKSGASATFRNGHFTLDPPWSYLTPIGHRGASGVVLQEVDSDGSDVPGSRSAFGLQQLKRVSRQYPGCVTNLTTPRLTRAKR